MIEIANSVLNQLEVEQYIMLTHRSNWADEIDTEGFILMTMSQWEEIKRTLLNADPGDFSLEYGIGTNEFINVPSEAQKVIDMYYTYSVPKETYEFLKNITDGGGRFGIIPHPLELIGEY